MSPWTHVVGWTLIHFIWQGAALAVTGAAALRLCRERSPDTRYAIACVVLAAMLMSPVVTAGVLMTSNVTISPVGRASEAIAPPGTMATGSVSGTGDQTVSMRVLWAGVDSVLPLIVFAWLAGVTLLLLRMVGGLSHVRRLQIRALALDSSHWQAVAERVASRLGVRVGVHVVESSLVDSPTAVGWLRPVILLPIAALASLTPSQVEAILVHELVHIRRQDYLVNIAQTVAETLLFFHPGVWWVSAQIRLEREHCCDDVAVQVSGDPVNYAEALVQLEARRSRGTTLALAAVDGSLTKRVRRLLNAPTAHQARSIGWGITLALTMALTFVTGAMYVSSSGPSDGAQVPSPDAAQELEPIASPDTFGWQVRRTSRFDIHYYAALEPNLEQVADSAERAYERVRSELQYDLSFRVPLVLFKTRSDFAQQRIIPEVGGAGAIARGEVISFSEHKRNRVVILVEEEPDRLYRLITHELTHIFAFDIIPRSPTNFSRVPVWIDEGLAEYMTGVWDPANLKQIQDLVAADNVPKMAALAGSVNTQSHAEAAHLGHAVFEFIEAQYGKPAVWSFLLEVRRSIVDGAGNPYQAALNRTPDELDAAFTEYLRRRFGP